MARPNRLSAPANPATCARRTASHRGGLSGAAADARNADAPCVSQCAMRHWAVRRQETKAESPLASRQPVGRRSRSSQRSRAWSDRGEAYERLGADCRRLRGGAVSRPRKAGMGGRSGLGWPRSAASRAKPGCSTAFRPCAWTRRERRVAWVPPPLAGPASSCARRPPPLPGGGADFGREADAVPPIGRASRAARQPL